MGGGGEILLGRLGDESLVVIKEVFVAAEDPVHGFVSAFTVSVGMILQW